MTTSDGIFISKRQLMRLQIADQDAPVSGRLFSISVFDTGRLVRELAETGS
jgi:hypothetical protein